MVLSESEWNYFQEKYDRTAILIPNAVQMRQPLPCNLICEKYGLEAGSYILYVGRISPEKGPLDLVEGYLKAHTDKKLVLAGPFAETEYCTTVREKIAGNPNIITTGYVVGDALLELYSNCALFVLPSHTEGLSLSLLEALSLGVKCLVSDIPENTTVTADYGTEFRTEDTDSLAQALERDTAQPLTPEQSKAQLDYVRAQTCPDWEAILVDDGSPDGCGALCDAAARQDARFRVIHQKNAGVGAARNAGLAAARGTYVQFLDSDDALEPQMVEVLCRTAKQTDADLILFGGYEEHYATRRHPYRLHRHCPGSGRGIPGRPLPAIVPAAVGHVAGHAAAVPPPLHRRRELPLYRLQDRGGRPVFRVLLPAAPALCGGHPGKALPL